MDITDARSQAQRVRKTAAPRRSTAAHAQPGAGWTGWLTSLGIGTQLLVAVNSLCLLLATIFLSIDYPREITRLVEARRVSLTEEAVIVQLAVRGMWHHGDESLQDYIDSVCHRITSDDAPGHQIAVQLGDYVLQSRSNGPPSQAMFDAVERAAQTEDHRGTFQGRALVVGDVGDADLRVYVSEYDDDIKRLVRGEVIARIGRLALLAIVAGIVVNALLLRLFVMPLDSTIAAVGRIGAGEFDVRIEGATSRELRQLAGAVNDMSSSLAAAERRRAAQLDKARRIQEYLLPGTFNLPDLSVALLYEPAEEVAGDYYDHIVFPDGSVLLWLADVSGHGIPAAMAAAMLKSLLATATEQCTSAGDVMQFINRHFCAATLPETFATAVAVRFSPDRKVIEFANAGHPAPLVLGPTGETNALKSTGMPLGVDAGAVWEQQEYTPAPGDRLLLYTDGLTETFDEMETCFGRQRLIDLLQAHSESPPDRFLRTLSHALADFRGPRPAGDDVTAVMVVIDHNGQ